MTLLQVVGATALLTIRFIFILCKIAVVVEGMEDGTMPLDVMAMAALKSAGFISNLREREDVVVVVAVVVVAVVVVAVFVAVFVAGAVCFFLII